MLVFRVIIPGLLLIIQILLYTKTRKWIREVFPHRRWMQWLAAGLFIVMNSALLYLMLFRPRVTEFPTWFWYAGVYPFFLWQGATIFIGLILLISTIIKAPFQLFGALLNRLKPVRQKVELIRSSPTYRTFNSSRRAFIRQSMYGLTAASFGTTAYGMMVGKSEHEVTDVVFPVKNLPHELNGFTIAMVSDVHSGINMTKKEMDEYVNITNSLQCDLILVTGDFVNNQTAEVYPFAESFSNLRAPHGVYGVMGNHDYFAPQPEIVAREVDACGIKLLLNDKVVIQKNGGSLYLIGVDDVGNPKRAAAAMDIAIGSAPLKIPKLMMIHRPYFLEQVAERNIDLVLSGHTHGGQVVLGRFGETTIAPASLASRYVWGKYKIGNTHMYVNRGIGTVGLPIRINCAPEITKITLVPEMNAGSRS